MICRATSRTDNTTARASSRSARGAAVLSPVAGSPRAPAPALQASARPCYGPLDRDRGAWRSSVPPQTPRQGFKISRTLSESANRSRQPADHVSGVSLLPAAHQVHSLHTRLGRFAAGDSPHLARGGGPSPVLPVCATTAPQTLDVRLGADDESQPTVCDPRAQDERGAAIAGRKSGRRRLGL
jgi:hypothetical protein